MKEVCEFLSERFASWYLEDVPSPMHDFVITVIDSLYSCFTIHAPHLKIHVGVERGVKWGRSVMVDGFTNEGDGGVTLMVARSRSGANIEPISAC